jgi:hypothetical protein
MKKSAESGVIDVQAGVTKPKKSGQGAGRGLQVVAGL